MATIIHLMGPSCAGKSTLIARMLRVAGPSVGAVEVGMLLRAKYGEARFAGQAAPKDTQAEAWEMYVSGVKAEITKGKKIVLVDGQPRDVQQAQDIVGLWRAPHRAAYVLLDAEHSVRERRCRNDVAPGRDLDKRIERLTNDYRNCYVVLATLLGRNEVVRVFDTTDMTSVNSLAEQVIHEYLD